MSKVYEENIPLGAGTRYDVAPSTVVKFVNKARQIAQVGPGLSEFECPLIPNLSKGEVARFVGEISKLHPSAEIRVLHATGGVGIFVMADDPTYKKPEPTKVDLATVGGDAHHRRLWQVCRDQADYVAGRDTNHHENPDCSSGCKYFFPLEGKHGMDWGVCTEPRSPRAGLLTFEHMGCPFFAPEPDDLEAVPDDEESEKASEAKSSKKSSASGRKKSSGVT